MAFDYRRYRFLDLLFSPFQCVCSYKLTIKAIRFFASVDIFTVCSDRTPTADAILKTTSLARRYGISSFATHGPLSATVFMVLYLKQQNKINFLTSNYPCLDLSLLKCILPSSNCFHSLAILSFLAAFHMSCSFCIGSSFLAK